MAHPSLHRASATAAVGLAVLLWAAAAAAADDPSTLTAAQTAAIDRIAATVIARQATPSVAIGVAKNGRLIFAKAYGYRNLDDRVPADPDTVYGIGSNSKQFTAAAILLLRDAGTVDIDAPVGRYLHGIGHGNDVTVRNLLTHTGGYAEYTELDGFDRLAARPVANDEIIAIVAGRPLAFAPGTKWQYSNTGFVMLASIVEHVTGMSYADFVRTRIFEPLGMTRTRYGDQQAIEPDRAVGYSRYAMGAQRHEHHVDYSWYSGAGAIESTVADLEKWNRAIDRGALLSPASRDLMHTTFKLADGTDTHYAFGLFVQPLPGGKHVVMHGGDTTGLGSQDARFVDDGIDVIVLTNQEPPCYNPIVSAVYNVVAAPSNAPAAASPPPAAAPAPRPSPVAAPDAVPSAKPDVDVLARQWLEDAIAGRIDMQKLRPAARAALSLEHNRAALRELSRFVARTYRLLSVDRRAPVSTYQYLLQTDRRTLVYLFAVDDDGSINGGQVFDPNPLAEDRSKPSS